MYIVYSHIAKSRHLASLETSEEGQVTGCRLCKHWLHAEYTSHAHRYRHKQVLDDHQQGHERMTTCLSRKCTIVNTFKLMLDTIIRNCGCIDKEEGQVLIAVQTMGARPPSLVVPLITELCTLVQHVQGCLCNIHLFRLTQPLVKLLHKQLW